MHILRDISEFPSKILFPDSSVNSVILGKEYLETILSYKHFLWNFLQPLHYGH